MLVYTKSRVAVPSFLFTVGTVTGAVIALLALLGLTGFLLAFCISLKHGLHEGHAHITPRLLEGLLWLRGLTCCRLKGLTIAVIATAVQGAVGLVRTAVGLAMQVKLLTRTLLSDVTSQAPRCLALWVTLGFRFGLYQPYFLPWASHCASQPWLTRWPQGSVATYELTWEPLSGWGSTGSATTLGQTPALSQLDQPRRKGYFLSSSLVQPWGCPLM